MKELLEVFPRNRLLLTLPAAADVKARISPSSVSEGTSLRLRCDAANTMPLTPAATGKGRYLAAPF